VKFRKIWQTGNKYLLYQFFRSGKRHKLAKIEKKLPVQTLPSSSLKFVSRQIRWAVKILEEFTQRKFKK